MRMTSKVCFVSLFVYFVFVCFCLFLFMFVCFVCLFCFFCLFCLFVCLHCHGVLSHKRVALYSNHVIVKDSGSTKVTPWHQDQAYYEIDGKQVRALFI